MGGGSGPYHSQMFSHLFQTSNEKYISIHQSQCCLSDVVINDKRNSYLETGSFLVRAGAHGPSGRAAWRRDRVLNAHLALLICIIHLHIHVQIWFWGWSWWREVLPMVQPVGAKGQQVRVRVSPSPYPLVCPHVRFVFYIRHKLIWLELT